MEHELARHIGPMARVVMRQAIRRCSSLAELKKILAGEIADEAEREDFLNS